MKNIRSSFLFLSLSVLFSSCLIAGAAFSNKTGKSVNRLPNPDFSLGLRGWDHFVNLGAGSTFEVVDTEIAGEKIRALKVELADPAKHPIVSTHLMSEWIEMPPGADATFSMYARVQEGAVEMQLLTVDSKTREKYTLSNKWERYVIEGPFSAPEAVEAFAIQLRGEGTVLLSRAQFQLGELTEFEDVTEAKIGLEVDDGVGLLYPGEQASISAWAHGALLPGDRLVAEWTRWGEVSEVVLDAKALEYDDSVWVWPIEASNEYGLYMLNLQLFRDGTVIDSVDHTVGFVPQAQKPTPEVWDSFAVAVTLRDLPEQAEKAIRMGASMLRLHGYGVALLPRFRWIAEAAPESVQWPLCQLVEDVHEMGLSQFPYLIDHHGELIERILGNPKQQAQLAEFSRRLAKRYKGIFQAYQIWNEPEFKVSGETYAKVHNLMVPALNEGDPSAKIVGFGSVHARSRFLEKAVEAGGKVDGVDAVAAHFYLNGQPPEQSLPQEIEALMGKNRRLLNELNLSEAELWDTESGFFMDEKNLPRPMTSAAPPSFYKTPGLHAAYNVRQQIVGMVMGVDLRSTFLVESLTPFYRWMPHGLFRPDAFRGPRPAAVTYAQMTHQLRGATLRGLWQDEEGEQFVAVFERAGKAIWVTWTLYDEATLSLPGKEPDLVFGMLGGRRDVAEAIKIGPTPSYLRWSDLPPAEPGTEEMLNDWVPFNPSQVGVESPRSETQPPVNLEEIVEGEAADFIRWTPGVVRAEGASSGRLLELSALDSLDERDRVVQYRIILSPGEEGLYEFWVACAPLFGAENSDLEVRMNGSDYRSIRGSDQPFAYPVKLGEGVERTVTWDRLGVFELEAGANILGIRAVGGGGQLLDRVGWFRK